MTTVVSEHLLVDSPPAFRHPVERKFGPLSTGLSDMIGLLLLTTLA